MATNIDQPLVTSLEKALLQNTLLAEKFLLVFKKILSQNTSFPSVIKEDITKATKEYLQSSLKDLNIELPNIDSLSEYLTKHMDSIQPILAVCNQLKKEMDYIVKMRLIYEIESEDLSNTENVTLYVQIESNFIESNKKLKEIVSRYDEYFIDSGILFTSQIDIE